MAGTPLMSISVMAAPIASVDRVGFESAVGFPPREVVRVYVTHPVGADTLNESTVSPPVHRPRPHVVIGRAMDHTDPTGALGLRVYPL